MLAPYMLLYIRYKTGFLVFPRTVFGWIILFSIIACMENPKRININLIQFQIVIIAQYCYINSSSIKTCDFIPGDCNRQTTILNLRQSFNIQVHQVQQVQSFHLNGFPSRFKNDERTRMPNSIANDKSLLRNNQWFCINSRNNQYILEMAVKVNHSMVGRRNQRRRFISRGWFLSFCSFFSLKSKKR